MNSKRNSDIEINSNSKSKRNKVDEEDTSSRQIKNPNVLGYFNVDSNTNENIITNIISNKSNIRFSNQRRVKYNDNDISKDDFMNIMRCYNNDIDRNTTITPNDKLYSKFNDIIKPTFIAKIDSSENNNDENDTNGLYKEKYYKQALNYIGLPSNVIKLLDNVNKSSRDLDNNINNFFSNDGNYIDEHHKILLANDDNNINDDDNKNNNNNNNNAIRYIPNYQNRTMSWIKDNNNTSSSSSSNNDNNNNNPINNNIYKESLRPIPIPVRELIRNNRYIVDTSNIITPSISNNPDLFIQAANQIKFNEKEENSYLQWKTSIDNNEKMVELSNYYDPKVLALETALGRHTEGIINATINMVENFLKTFTKIDNNDDNNDDNNNNNDNNNNDNNNNINIIIS